MATAIHHGPPGSFKSFAVVQRFLVPALLEGRVVVTNVRGCNSLQRISDALNITFPESAALLFLDTNSEAGRRCLAGWFHWVPFRAMIVIDEAQRIYPDRRDFKLESLDTPLIPDGIIPEVLSEGRPEDVFTAYDMQRHYQWDIFLSTPNIAKIKSEIRQSSQWAYRHRDVSKLVPFLFKNSWLEFQHDPETSGKAAAHVVGVPVRHKADKRMFNCYDSTATGEHSTTQTGRHIFQDPKILLFLFIILASALFTGYRFISSPSLTPSKFIEQKKPPVNGGSVAPADAVSVDAQVAKSANHSANAVPVNVLPAEQAIAPGVLKLLTIAEFKNGIPSAFYVQQGADTLIFKVQLLIDQGFKFRTMSFCSVLVDSPGGVRSAVRCVADAFSSCSVNVSVDQVYFKLSGCKPVLTMAANDPAKER